MTTDDTRYADLLHAASALAYSHDCRMDSTEEWDDLHRAIIAAEEADPKKGAPGYHFKGATLVRLRTLSSGEQEDHTCDVDDIEQVGHAIEEKNGDWFVVADVADDTQRDWIVAHIAVEFLKGRGLLRETGTGHRLVAETGFTSDQAVAEFVVASITAMTTTTTANPDGSP